MFEWRDQHSHVLLSEHDHILTMREPSVINQFQSILGLIATFNPGLKVSNPITSGWLKTAGGNMAQKYKNIEHVKCSSCFYCVFFYEYPLMFIIDMKKIDLSF